MKLKIYTKKGDKGKTFLADGTHHSKTKEVFWVMGEIDELMAWIGLCVSKLQSILIPVIPAPSHVIPAKAGILNSKIPDRLPANAAHQALQAGALLVRNDKIKNIRKNLYPVKSEGRNGALEIRINQLQKIQENLFCINSILAKAKNIKLDIKKETKLLESSIDAMEKELPKLKNFILPGGHELSSLFQIARVKCRRAERQMVLLSLSEKKVGQFLPFINRLSDYFFVLTRFVNFKMGEKEKIWKQ